MSRGNQSRCNAQLKVADSRINPPLHRLAGKMIPAENDINGKIREMRLCAQACVDDPCMRTGGKHADASSTNPCCDKSLVHDQRIGFTDIAAERMMAGQAGFVIGNPINRAASEEEAITNGV